MYIIYKITSTSMNKSYIGITCVEESKETASAAIEDRFKEHARENDPLGASISIWGEQAFARIELDRCYTKERALELEHYYIELYNTLSPNGYNRKP